MPRKHAKKLGRLIQRAVSALISHKGLLLAKHRQCCLCDRRLRSFMPLGDRHGPRSSFTAALGVVGSNVDQYRCPYCRAHDRARHLYLYMRESGFLERLRGAEILHFAPEAQLQAKFRALEPRRYVMADLTPHADGWVEADLTAMPFESSSFDVLIANHVLEHVDDVGAALAEIRRVLRPDGYAILQTPYAAMLTDTFEDPGIRTPEARTVAYGQWDHVRLFGANIVSIIEGAGFVSCVASHQDVLHDYNADRWGLNSAEPFMCFRSGPERQLG